MSETLKIIVPMAGLGSRLRPHTLTRPRPLLPLAGKTVLDYFLDTFTSIPLTRQVEYVFIVGPMGEQIRDYISSHHEFAETEKDCHQVEFMFACEIDPDGVARLGDTPDDGQIDVHWLPLDRLMDYRLYPLTLRPRLMNLTDDARPVYLGDIN